MCERVVNVGYGYTFQHCECDKCKLERLAKEFIKNDWQQKFDALYEQFKSGGNHECVS